jgi:hypothetical protein
MRDTTNTVSNHCRSLFQQWQLVQSQLQIIALSRPASTPSVRTTANTDGHAFPARRCRVCKASGKQPSTPAKTCMYKQRRRLYFFFLFFFWEYRVLLLESELVFIQQSRLRLHCRVVKAASYCPNTSSRTFDHSTSHRNWLVGYKSIDTERNSALSCWYDNMHSRHNSYTACLAVVLLVPGILAQLFGDEVWEYCEGEGSICETSSDMFSDCQEKSGSKYYECLCTSGFVPVWQA